MAPTLTLRTERASQRTSTYARAQLTHTSTAQQAQHSKHSTASTAQQAYTSLHRLTHGGGGVVEKSAGAK